MQVKDRIVVVTGAASGIGRAMAHRFAKAGAKLVVSADYNEAGAQETAEATGGVAIRCDVSKEEDIKALIETVEADHGPIDLFCGNAGILTVGGLDVPNDEWQRIWEINVMAHVWAARHLVPRMIARGGGYFFNTASAAGLLNQVGAAPYGVTKHAAVGFAEWLKITYGERGIGVTLLCPQAVKTAMTVGREGGVASGDGMLDADFVADECLKCVEAETFLVLPHPEVLTYMRRKTDDYDRWITGMQRLQRKHGGEV